MPKTSSVLFLSISILTVVSALSGCKKTSGLKTHPVKGTVTYNGKPVAGATVNYIPTDVNAPRTSAVTDQDGQFSLSTFVGPNEVLRGAPAGEYKVSITKASDEGSAASAMTTEGTAQEREKAMQEMWAKVVTDKEKPNRPKPKPAIPEKYANPATSGLSAIVVIGENDPREFKLTDE